MSSNFSQKILTYKNRERKRNNPSSLSTKLVPIFISSSELKVAYLMSVNPQPKDFKSILISTLKKKTIPSSHCIKLVNLIPKSERIIVYYIFVL